MNCPEDPHQEHRDFLPPYGWNASDFRKVQRWHTRNRYNEAGIASELPAGQGYHVLSGKDPPGEGEDL